MEMSPPSDAVAKRARMDSDDQDRIDSKADGRTLVCNNRLREVYKSTYHNPGNTRLWCGQSLDLGQAFKLAVWTHYGSQMPVEKRWYLPQRRALFRTASYYELSMDGDESEEQDSECMDHAEFSEFSFILVQAAKQMRYNILVEGRIFFGDNVFTTLRPAKKYQVTTNVTSEI